MDLIDIDVTKLRTGDLLILRPKHLDADYSFRLHQYMNDQLQGTGIAYVVLPPDIIVEAWRQDGEDHE